MELGNGLSIKQNKLEIYNRIIKTENNERFEILNKMSLEDYKEFIKQTGIALPYRDSLSLGEGVTAKIRITKNLETGQYAALKIVPETEYLMYQKLLNCENVINPLGVAKKDKDLYYVFLPVMGGGDLHKVSSKIFKAFQTGIINKKELQQMKMHIVGCVFNGLLNMHRRNIYHLDTHPKNIMFDKEGSMNIIDFGFSKQTNGRKKDIYNGPMIDENKILPRWTLPPEFVMTSEVKLPTIDFEKADAYRLGATICTVDNYDKLLQYWNKIDKKDENEKKKTVYHLYNRHLRELSYKREVRGDNVLTGIGKKLMKIDPNDRSTIKSMYEEFLSQRKDKFFSSEDDYRNVFKKVMACEADVINTDISYDIFTQIIDENTKKDQ